MLDIYRYAVTLKELSVIQKTLGSNIVSNKYLAKAKTIFIKADKSDVYTTPFGAYCKAP